MQDEFTNQLAAEVRQHQQAEPCQGPADGFVAPPAKLMTAPEQQAENDPGEDGQQRLMHQVLCEKVVKEQPAGSKRGRQQQPACQQEAEQQAFHGLQWREVLDQAGGMLVPQMMVLQQQQQGLEYGKGEHSVCQDRQQNMREYARLFGYGWRRPGGCELGEDDGEKT